MRSAKLKEVCRKKQALPLNSKEYFKKLKISKINFIAIKLIKKYFSNRELVGLVTSNFYSILFYNSQVWHIPSLKYNLKQQLLSVSARALKACMTNPDQIISFKKMQETNKRETPNQLMAIRSCYSNEEKQENTINITHEEGTKCQFHYVLYFL